MTIPAPGKDGIRRYGQWRNPERVTDCVWSMSDPPHYLWNRQCSRKRGHGEGGLLCRQHSKMAERE